MAEARALVLGAAKPLGAERVSLHAARGRILREDVLAARAHPPFRAAAMDGYALSAADTPGVVRLVGEAGAGRAFERALAPGECVRIYTGAPLPEGADSVLIQEDAARDGDLVPAPKLALASHVRAPGADFSAGAVVLRSGRVLDPAAVALAAASGRATLAVAQAPRLAVLSGGDEIVAPGAAPAPDQIFDSASFGVAALAESWGARAVGAPPLPDDLHAVTDAVRRALDAHDLTVLIGGASVGDHDHARPALRALGAVFLFERVAARPGKPTWFARLGERFVLGLPGNPASAFVCAQLFLRPLLDALQGRDPGSAPRTVRARTRTPIRPNGPREAYLRAAFDIDDAARAWVAPAPDQDSSLLTVFAAANALIRRAPNAAEVGEGALVDVLRL